MCVLSLSLQVPFTEGGYLIGSMCVLCGVLTVAFTVPIVVNNFTLYYAHAQSRNQLPPQKKRELQQKLIMKNQKATEFIKRLAINVQHRRKKKVVVGGQEEADEEDFNKLEDLKSPRTTTSRSVLLEGLWRDWGGRETGERERERGRETGDRERGRVPGPPPPG